LLIFIVLGNLANLSLFSATIRGPEVFLGGRPILVVSFIFVQIIVTLVLTGVLSRRRASGLEGGR
jgi:hypothetical protein